MGILAADLTLSGEHDRARASGQHALAQARSFGDERALAWVLRRHYWATFDPDTPQERIASCAEMIRLAERLHDPELGRFRVLRGSGLGVTGAWRQDLSHARHRVVPPSAGVGRAVGG